MNEENVRSFALELGKKVNDAEKRCVQFRLLLREYENVIKGALKDEDTVHKYIGGAFRSFLAFKVLQVLITISAPNQTQM